MTPRSVGRAALLITALASNACQQDPAGPSPGSSEATLGSAQQALSASNKVLILGSTVKDGLDSREARAVADFAPEAQIDIVTPSQWKVMSAQQFMSYRALIIGDAACQSGTEAFQAAIDSRRNWGAIVDGDVAILATDPTTNGTELLVENGIRYALNSVQKRTGMYIALGCAYQNAPAGTEVALLEPFGSFHIQGVPGCADSAHVFEMYNDIISRDVSDYSLPGAGGCAARSVFTSYPERDFSHAGIAMRATAAVPAQKLYVDYTVDPGFETQYVGSPYILVRGAMTLGAGCGINPAPSGEECDLGDGLNGQPATSSQQPWETCSWSCRSNWCGDGVVDAEFGEECDKGEANGRTGDANGHLGECTAFCKVPNLMAVNRPPVALCQNVTAVAEYTCGAEAGIDSGSYDPDNDLVGCTQSPPGPYNIGNTTVTLTCTDEAGLSSTCTGVVTVADSVAPTIALNGQANDPQECHPTATYVDPGATASDLCEGTLPQSSIARTGSVRLSVPSTYSLTYQATDSSGNKSPVVTRTVPVADTLAPVITRTGQEGVTHECATPYVDQGATAADQCEGNLTPRIVQSGTVNTSAVGNYLIRYNVKDSGNRAALEATRTVFVRDRQAPTISLLGASPQTVECGGTYPDPGATASDTCAGALTPVVHTNNILMGTPGNYSISYRATDPSGNVVVSPNRAVTVADTKAPTLTLLGAASTTLECASPFSDPGATASDQCYGNLTSAIVKTGTVNNMVPAAYTLRYNVKDAKNNAAPEATRTVTVNDTKAPVITVTGPLTQAVECGASYTDPGATASDLCAGPRPAVATASANPNVPGSYTISYRATDPAGNTATSTTSRTVTVRDTLAPTLTLNGPAAQALECGSTYADPGATASDQCAGALPVAVAGSVNPYVPASYTLSYSANDGAGHSASASRTVAVSDTLAPTLSLIGSPRQSQECGTPYTDPGATASDVCAGDLTAAIQRTGNVNTSALGSYALGYSVADPSGHAASASREVTVSDTLAPAITVLGPLETTYECGSTYVDPGATASDACFGDLTAQIQATQVGDTARPSTFTIRYSVTDPAGNTTVAPVTRTVHVNDNEPPTLALLGPATQSLECGTPYSDPGATATDVCFGDVTSRIIRSGAVNSGAPGNYALVYNVTDPSGQAAPSVSRAVSVVDTLAPSITVNGSLSQQVECGTAYTDPGAVATDVCAGALPVTVSGSVNTNAPGSYTLGYTAADASGNTAASPSRTVAVVDTLAPTLSLLGSASQAVECGSSYTDPGATAADACTGDLTASIVKSGSVNTAALGNYSLSYLVADASGNTATASRSVTVRDTVGPQLQVLSGPSVLQCNGAPYVDPGATASDSCAGNLTSRITSTSNLDQTRAGQYTVTYSVTDDAGNTSTATRLLTVAGPCAVSCIDVKLNDYNLFLEDSYTGGHDVVGKVAAGGNISMEDFAVGSGLPASDISKTLVAGGNLTLNRGAVWGDTYYGGSLSTNQSVTFPRGTVSQGMPIDFAARFAELRSVSARLAALPANGTTKRESWGGVMLSGTNPSVNVFDVQASAFTGAKLLSISAPSGSFVVVNIRGASATFQGFGHSFSGVSAQTVLYNFVDTTSINAQGYGFWGTVLAPYANITFNNGSWDGGIYAKSFNGNAEGHINPLNERTICP
ncbi:immunoglobulin-like domain-containing protein [Hyalangium gracile]|uniref:immunoglobulin-like domain-containing protein n=1 Tax=Hyalangium gracile TaxID=394092 RepID=UPI001CCC5392|nr:immunoglobulin-like domain-containing protein [Hyalangium gracile]